jgi:hypothetical protein
LKDGTICAAGESRKPYRRPGQPPPYVDEDGCFAWYRADFRVPAKYDEANRIITMLAVVNRLNTRKLIREHVEKRLDLIEAELARLVAAVEDLANGQAGSTPSPPNEP